MESVVEKLDGQMIMGVLVDQQVQFWTRKGHTAVGMTAGSAAASLSGDYEGLVCNLSARGCTPVFELTGRQSLIKADEGSSARLVLLAVRQHVCGGYLGVEQVAELAQQYKVPEARKL